MKHRDALFKGCTRPPMIMGVPMVPFAAMVALFGLLSAWVNLFVLLGAIPTYLVMRMITKHDDQQFRLLFLKASFCLPALSTVKFWKAYVTSPVPFRKNKIIGKPSKNKQLSASNRPNSVSTPNTR